MKIRKLLKEIKGVFILPKKSYYLGKIRYGCPYFYPRNFVSSIIHVIKLKHKDMPMVRRSFNKTFKLFGNTYWIEVGYPIIFHTTELGWKDKFESPRYEWSPGFYVFFFKWQFCIWWNSPIGYNDKYYEQILWYLYYSKKDIKVAKETWPWQDGVTKLSTWDDKYLIK